MESKYSIYTSVSTALAVGGTRAAGGGNASGRVATAALLRRVILYWRFESSSAAVFLVEAYSAMFDTEKFICEIELRPAIYNVTLKEYNNKHIKASSFSFMLFMPLLQNINRQNTSCLNDIHPVLWSKQYCSENAMYRLQSVPAATELPRFHRPSID